jgi:heat shock protein HslJ
MKNIEHIAIALFIVIFSSLTFGQNPISKTDRNALKKKQTQRKNLSSINLTKKKWMMVEINEETIEVPNPILQFYEKEKSFNIGFCNSIHGNYLFKGNALQLSKMTSTAKGCREPLDSYDRKLSEALGKTNRFTQTADSLVFLANNKSVLKFIFEKQSTISSKIFEEAEWLLTEIGDKKFMPEKSPASLRFGTESKSVSGKFGCSYFSGGYKFLDGIFKFRNLLTRRGICQPDENNEIAQTFIQALSKTDRFELNDKTLSFFEGETLLLKFIPMIDDSSQRF